MNTKGSAFGAGRDKPGPKTDLFAIWGQIEIGGEALDLYEINKGKSFDGRKFTLEDAFDQVAHLQRSKLSPCTVKKYYYRAKTYREQHAKILEAFANMPEIDWSSGLSAEDLDGWDATIVPKKSRRRRCKRRRAQLKRPR